MIERPYLDVMRLLVERLARDQITWAVTGSLGFALQGVPVVVHDIDIQTDTAGAYEIARRFARDVVRPVRFSAAERIRSHFWALRLCAIDVELMGDIEKRLADGSWERPVDVAKYRRWISVDGLRIPVLDLAYEAEAYERLGRSETATMLRRWLTKRETDIG